MHIQMCYVGILCIQDNSGMWHLDLKPWQHLPKGREEEQQAFVCYGSSGLNHAVTSLLVTESVIQLSKVSHELIGTSCTVDSG